MATLVFILNLCGLPRRALAAPTQSPTQNLTALRTDIAPPWVPDPDNRGTWSLLYSCVFTLVLCVWTAIHPNVPSYHESQISQWLRKLKWVLLAIIAPEFGAATACDQYFQAKTLIHTLDEIQSSYATDQSETQLPQNSQESDPEKAASKRRVFSQTYGYFAVMGGLAVDVSDIDDRLHSMTLMPVGLTLLAERGHFIEVSDDDIRDKSKANIFAKCLVILQVTWIALQTISRRATGYPLSPLEIHTLVHVACASVMYILWFRKPLDVQAPTIVSKAGFEDLVALMLMQAPRFGRTWYSHLDPPKEFVSVIKGPRSEASFLLFDDSALSRRNEGCSSCGRTTNVKITVESLLNVTPKTCDSCACLSNPYLQQAGIFEVRAVSSQIAPHPPAGLRCGPPPGVKAVRDLRSGDFTSDGIGLKPLMTWSSYHDAYRGCLRFLHRCPPQPALPAQISPALKERLPELFAEPDYYHEINLSLSEKDLKRWKLAGGAFLKEMEIRGVSDPDNGRYRDFEIAHLDSKGKTIDDWPWSRHLLGRRYPNAIGRSKTESQDTLLFIVWLLGSLYGGIHLALWNYDFPSRIESLLWRISATTLASAPALLVPCILLTVAMCEYDKYSGRRRERRAQESHGNGAFQCAPPSSSSTDWLRKIFSAFCSGVRYIIWNSWCEDVLVVVLLMFALAVVAAVVLYAFSRIFIVVESFISLRHVPIGVYEGGLGWSKYIPHL